MKTLTQLLIWILFFVSIAQGKTNSFTGNSTPCSLSSGSLQGLVAENESSRTIQVFSPPDSEYLQVRGTTEGAELLLYDNQGHVVVLVKARQDCTLIKFTELKKGLYHLRYRLRKDKFCDTTILIC